MLAIRFEWFIKKLLIFILLYYTQESKYVFHVRPDRDNDRAFNVGANLDKAGSSEEL